MNKAYKNIFLFGAFIILGVVSNFSGCEPPLTPDEIFMNPVDTASIKFIPPLTTIIEGPQNGKTITTDSITFRWRGNADAVQFSHKIDHDTAWSLFWYTDTSIVLNYLDEGAHKFSVRALHRNTTTIETNPQVISYIVDAVKGPSAMFFPKRKIVYKGDSFTYNVWAEEVNLLYGARLAILYNRVMVVIDSIQPGSMMQENGGTAILIPTINNTTGTAFVDIATVGRKPKGVSGSGTLATLYCRAVAGGTVDFTFSRAGCNFRDTTNTPIAIRDLVGGKVVVK